MASHHRTVGMHVCMCVCVFTYSLSKDVPIHTKLGMLISWAQDKTQKGQISGKLTWVWILRRADPVARKLSKMEERHQDHSSLFRWNTETKATPTKTVLGSSAGKDGFCSSETKHDTSTVLRLRMFLQQGDYKNKWHIKKKSWVRVPMKRMETNDDRRTQIRLPLFQ